MPPRFSTASRVARGLGLLAGSGLIAFQLGSPADRYENRYTAAFAQEYADLLPKTLDQIFPADADVMSFEEASPPPILGVLAREDEQLLAEAGFVGGRWTTTTGPRPVTSVVIEVASPAEATKVVDAHRRLVELRMAVETISSLPNGGFAVVYAPLADGNDAVIESTSRERILRVQTHSDSAVSIEELITAITILKEQAGP